MATEKISITVNADLMRWARSAAKRRNSSLSALIADALAQERQHQARQRYLAEALAGVPPEELERKVTQAYRELFGGPDSAL